MSSVRKRGFTLIELIVVIGIISLLSSIVLASLGNARAKARDARRLVDMHSIRTALELYRSKYGVYPNEGSGSCGGVAAGYNKPDGDTTFIPGLVSENIFSQTPGDPLSTGCDVDDYVYKYDRVDAGGAFACPQAFYILAVKNFETISGTHPSNPGFKCGNYDSDDSDFAWVIGGSE